MKNLSDIKAVFFDYDGVIAKPDDNIEAWIRACQRFHFKIIKNDWCELEGLKPEEIAQALLEKCSIREITSLQLTEEKKRQYEAIFNEKGHEAEAYKEIEQILQYLKKKGIKLGLVTGAIRSRVAKSIPALLSYFDTIVAADDEVDGKKIKGKPAPDPWLLAAENIDISPENCIVVENAVLGIKSAKLAKIFCIALQTTLEKRLLMQAGADLVLENHMALLNYFSTFL